MATLNEFRTVWTGVAGSPYYTTIRQIDSGPTTPQAFADAWEDFLVGLQGVTDNGLVAVVENDVRQIDSTTGETTGVITISGATVAMTAAGDALPPQTQLLCRLLTPTFVGGRRIRGRIFIPGQLELFNSVVGQPDAGLRTGVEDNLEDFITAVSNDLVVYSRTHHAFSAVNSVSVWNQWAVLRSRRD